jgi:hypothetical protein
MVVNHLFWETNKFIPQWDVKYLFLGTFNPGCGGNVHVDYYYRRPYNGFWIILKKYFDPQNQYPIDTFNNLKTFMVEKKIGCIDIISSVDFPDFRQNEICGDGYEDSRLFRVDGFTRTYTYQSIQEFILNQREKPCVYSTWGVRNNPNEFSQNLMNFTEFCRVNEISFNSLPSPSGRVYRGDRINDINQSWFNELNKCKSSS